MAVARRLVSEMETAVRTALDEATAAFFTQANLWTFLTRAAHVVHTEIRKLKADYFLVNLASTDGSKTILGESYAASSLAIVAGTKEYTLPPDLLELKLIECITSGYEDVEFDLSKDLTHPDFVGARRRTSNTAPTYFYADVVGERTLTIAPASDTALDLRIWYVSSACLFVTSTGASLKDIAAGTDELVMPHPGYMAVEQVATELAQLKDSSPDAAVYAALAQATVSRLFAAHARQTQDVEIVQGYLE